MNISFLDKLVLRTPCNPYHNKDVIDLDAIREALYLASPVLLQELDKSDKGQIKSEKDKRKLRESLYKYHSRSCTRCTPFGLFAGVGTCEWGDKTDITLSDKRRRETRLDMNYVCALGQFITSIREIRDCLLFYPNNSVYRIADKVRYVEYKYIRTRRSHAITEVDGTAYLDKILELATKGALLKDLAMSITDDDIGMDEAMEFVINVLDAQLLKSEIDPNVTGDYYFDILLRKLRHLEKDQLRESKQLEHLINILSQIDARVKGLDEKFNNDVIAYKEIIELIKQLPVKFEENTLFQTDLYLGSGSGIVNKNVKDELTKAMRFLNKLNTIPQETSLSKFAEEYYKRYEDAELPLLYVLDTESGIGYNNNKGADNNPLVDGLVFPMMAPFTNSIHYNPIGKALHRKLKEAYRNKEYSVLFTDDDFKQIPDPGERNIPATFAVSFSLFEDDKVILNFAGGKCAATMLGRFAVADEQILDISRTIIEHENTFFADKIIAEVVHLPESRTGNILMRPAFREYEIPYLANAFTTPDKVIPLSDLYISIRGRKEVVLRSKKLNKEIVPRLTNAHNFSFNALPVYQFLCDLQMQGSKSYFSFLWGPFAQEYQFKPRAVYGNTILKAATWDLRREDIKELVDNGFNKERITLFLEKWQMPATLLLADSDHTLMVEWYNELSFSTFINTVKKRSAFTLQEHLFSGGTVRDNNGNVFENEFHAFVVNGHIHKGGASKKPPAAQTTVKRTFPIGSEWLYFKIYTGIKTADRLLSDHIKPLTEDMQVNGLIDKWFFIRYSDPDRHLRLRFHIPDMNNYGKVINKISRSINTLLDEKMVWKIQADTYDREIERYGVVDMEDCENYFWHDSVFATGFINAIIDQDAENVRWIAGFRAVDELLNSFGFNIEAKKDFVHKLAGNFKRQYGDYKLIQTILDKKFRSLRKDIELNLDREKDADNGLQELWDLLDEKTRQTHVIAKRINESRQVGLVDEEAYEQLLTSLLHMMLNRLFRSEQQMHELVIYDLLFLYYRSMIARKKSQAVSTGDFSLAQGQVLKPAESLGLDI